MSEIEKKEEWYLNIDYREAKEIIRNKLQGMTQNFIGIGFYLRQIKESEGFRKDGYDKYLRICRRPVRHQEIYSNPLDADEREVLPGRI